MPRHHHAAAEEIVLHVERGERAALRERKQALDDGAAARILADPDYVARLASMAVEPMVMTREQASAFVAGEVRKWKTVAAAAKIQID
jgi:tripartite-type tricarboxylate transporter receptor subunit TctC